MTHRKYVALVGFRSPRIASAALERILCRFGRITCLRILMVSAKNLRFLSLRVMPALLKTVGTSGIWQICSSDVLGYKLMSSN